MINFLQDMRAVHAKSLAFMAALPLVAALPLLAEFIQHVVEMNIGMYDGVEGAKAAESSADRMNVGFFKVLAISLPAYFITRWLHSGGDKGFAVRADRPAVLLFSLVMALHALFAWLGLFVFTEGPVGIGFFVFGLMFMPLIARFFVGAPLGILISPVKSIRTMLPHAAYAILFAIIAPLPLMVVHYALGIGAIFVPGEAAKWGLLAFDSLVTAWLAMVICATQYVIATRPSPLAPADGAPGH